MNVRFRNVAVTAIASLALSLSLAVPKASADDDRREHCQRAVEKAEARLDQAVQRHGERSRQADQRRGQLNAERERCWNQYHQWWNGREHRWETERNWDRDRDDRRDDDHRDHDRQ